nr:type II toxin-antitoxin system YoeB family toxin [Mycolicibacter sp. MYC101]
MTWFGGDDVCEPSTGHRLVYRVVGEDLQIIQARYHY